MSDALASPGHFHDKRREALRFEKLERELQEAHDEVARGKKRHDMLATELRALQKKAAADEQHYARSLAGLTRGKGDSVEGRALTRSEALGWLSRFEREGGNQQPELKNLLRQVEGWHIDKERLERQRDRLQLELDMEKEAHRKTMARYEAQVRACVCRI